MATSPSVDRAQRAAAVSALSTGMHVDSPLSTAGCGRSLRITPSVALKVPKEAEMRKSQKFILTVVVVSAPFVSSALPMAGIDLANHSETLLLDA